MVRAVFTVYCTNILFPRVSNSSTCNRYLPSLLSSWSHALCDLLINLDGENASLLIQNFVLIAMAWNLSATPVTAQEKLVSSGSFVAFSIFVMYLLPENLWYLLMSGTWPVMIYARGSQILETFQVKHTGNLSIVTTSMNLVGSLIRVGTTVQETGDKIILAGYILSFLLSFAMFVQYFLYLKNTQQFAAERKTD